MTRILYLDRFRFLVVSLAILSHVLNKHAVMETDLEQGARFAMLFTRMATPSLLIILGIMVQIVYAPRFQSEPALTSRRILYRALQCYGAILIIVIVKFLTGQDDANHALQAALFLKRVSNGTIFQLYALLLPITIGLLWLQRWTGPAGLVLVAVLVWIGAPLVSAIDSMPHWRLRDLGSILLGFGDTWGPSIYHGLSLVVFGMLTGAVISRGRDRSTWLASAVGAGVLAAAALMIVANEVAQIGLRSFASGIVEVGIYRWNNDIQYYAFGIVAALALLTLCHRLSQHLHQSFFVIPDRLGRYTLTYFLLGEVLVQALPDPMLGRVTLVVLAAIAYLALAGGLTLLAQRMRHAFASRGRTSSSAGSGKV